MSIPTLRTSHRIQLQHPLFVLAVKNAGLSSGIELLAQSRHQQWETSDHGAGSDGHTYSGTSAGSSCALQDYSAARHEELERLKKLSLVLTEYRELSLRARLALTSAIPARTAKTVQSRTT